MSARLASATLAVLMGISAAGATAQQYITEEADIESTGTCFFQFWYGESSAWIQPSCAVLPRLELTAGVAQVREEATPFGRWTAELKVPLRTGRKPTRFSAVAGIVSDPESMSAPTVGYAALAYGVFTEELGRITLHQNLGWIYDTTANSKHGVYGGLRVDGRLTRRIFALAEIFGATNGDCEFQAGARALLLRERLQIDLSYGDVLFLNGRGAGWAIALSVNGPAR